MVNYQDGKVYTIINDLNDNIYVGSTAVPRLSTRMVQHRSNSRYVAKTSGIYTAMRTLGVDHFTIILHHVFPCGSKDELFAEEMKTLDTLIVAGKIVYNNIIAGKPNADTIAKMSAAQKGLKGEKSNSFKFGSLRKCSNNGIPNSYWIFQYNYDAGKQINKYFSIKKYGDYGAHWRAEELRRQIYPEWGTEEDCTCDDFGEIEWD